MKRIAPILAAVSLLLVTVSTVADDTITVCFPHNCPTGWYAAATAYAPACGVDSNWHRDNATICARVPSRCP